VLPALRDVGPVGAVKEHHITHCHIGGPYGASRD